VSIFLISHVVMTKHNLKTEGFGLEPRPRPKVTAPRSRPRHTKTVSRLSLVKTLCLEA